jgi:predicted GNAT family N-acyltransferase
MGSDGTIKGVFAQVLAFCAGQISHIRADTHEVNSIMQDLLEKHGFARRGMIYVEDGTPRIAYEYQR